MELAPHSPPSVAASNLRSATWAIALAVVALTALYWNTAASMVAIWWRSETFTHGFLIAPLSIWLAWRQRHRLAAVPIRPFAPAIAGVLLAGFGWLLGELGSVAAAQHFCYVFSLQFAVIAILGWEASWIIAFPLAFLLFAVPFGEFLMPVMMDRTADFTVMALRASGIPIFREGNHFVIPTGSWSVVEACSGVRYLIASFMGGVLFAHLYYRTPYKKALLILASIALPVVANWVRAYLIVMIGHLSDNELAVGADHLIYGWVFFGVVIMLLFWVASFWAEDDDITASPTRQESVVAKPPFLSPRAAALACVAAAGAWPMLSLAVANTLPFGTPTLVLPEEVGSWKQVPLAENTPHPRLPGAVASRSVSYQKGEQSVSVHVAFFRRQMDGQEVANSDNIIVRVDDRTWQIIRERNRPLNWLNEPVVANTTLISGGGHRFEAVDFYWVDGRYTNRRSTVKLLVAVSKLLGHGDDAARVVIVARTADDAPDAHNLIDPFARELAPAIDRLLADSGAVE
jgi:exosortase A